MKLLKKILTVFLLFDIMTTFLTGCSTKTMSTSSNVVMRSPVNIGVVLYSFDDLYMVDVKESLEDIQINNPDKVKFTFYDGKDNQSVEETIINNLIQNKNFDMLFVDLVNRDAEAIRNVIDKARVHNIPLVFTYLNPGSKDVIKSYDKAFVVGQDDKEVGSLQGKLILDIWNTNKASIDKNNDNILQYVMLRGSSKSAANIRSQHTVKEINSKIKAEPLQILNANFNKELAKDAINSLILKYDGKIEAIIADNDAMAIGAIEALQTYGYNTGDITKTIAVIGIHGIPEARELIDKGYMAGTVIQNPSDTAEALYNVGMNLFSGKNPIEGTNYKVDKEGVTIFIPSQEYTMEK